MSAVKMVTYDQLMLPLMKALVNLGGSGSIDEIYEAVVELEKFDDETLQRPRGSNRIYVFGGDYPFTSASCLVTSPITILTIARKRRISPARVARISGFICARA